MASLPSPSPTSDIPESSTTFSSTQGGQSYSKPEPIHSPGASRSAAGACDPVIIAFAQPSDPRNPRDYRLAYRWYLSCQGSIQMFCVTFATSSYTGSYDGLSRRFGSSSILNIAGLSTYVIGLALGALLWAPLSEIYGRKAILLPTLAAFSAFGGAVAFANSMATVLICRFFMGAAGASILSNSPGMLNDIWSPRELALPMTINSISPFLGPILGPVVAGFISEYVSGKNGWRWVNGVPAIFGVVTLAFAVFIPETYPPVLLRRLAHRATTQTTVLHISTFDVGRPAQSVLQTLVIFIKRPFVFLFLEPIVFCLSIYTAIIFAILYLFFEAFPLIYRVQRGWSEGLAGLPFLALAVGLFVGLPISSYCARIYLRACDRSTGRAPPEQRLWFAMIGSALLPISLFWMAWTSPSSVHWLAPTIAGVPFGVGMLGMMSSVMAYLGDTYTIYAASIFAANSLFRYILGGLLPLAAGPMFEAMGTPWALTFLGFLALAGAPLPWIFYRYGAAIRSHSKHAPVQPAPLPPPREEGQPEAREPIRFLNQGDEAVRAEEAMDGLDPDAVDLENGLRGVR